MVFSCGCTSTHIDIQFPKGLDEIWIAYGVGFVTLKESHAKSKRMCEGKRSTR